MIERWIKSPRRKTLVLWETRHVEKNLSGKGTFRQDQRELLIIATLKEAYENYLEGMDTHNVSTEAIQQLQLN